MNKDLYFVHFSTQVTGGAGYFSKSIHSAMQELGIFSILITREQNDLKNSVIIKPLKRIASSLHARWFALLNKVCLIKSKYATFGIERSPVEFSDLRLSLGSRKPTAFLFYWVSYFISFKCMFELRQAYPDIPFVFVCLDEAFLTGGCHYSWGCNGYRGSCSNCPSTILPCMKKNIENEFTTRLSLIPKINPIVFYPSTKMQQMGNDSSLLKGLRSEIVPLGAISMKEKNHKSIFKTNEDLLNKVKNNRLTLLIRSSSEYRKGCDLFVDAIRKLNAKIPDLRSQLEIVSIGDLTLNECKIDEYVDHYYFGFVQRNELMALYEKVDALIVTSREDAGPIMINEFIALEKFVISTQVGVADDLITDKKNGLIVPHFTSKAIMDTLIFLLNNYELYFNQKPCDYASMMDSSRLTFDGYIRTMIDKIKDIEVSDEF